MTNSTYIGYQVATKEHTNLESSTLTHTHLLLMWMIIVFIASTMTLIYL